MKEDDDAFAEPAAIRNQIHLKNLLSYVDLSNNFPFALSEARGRIEKLLYLSTRLKARSRRTGLEFSHKINIIDLQDLYLVLFHVDNRRGIS